jgi:hypothetical protein
VDDSSAAQKGPVTADEVIELHRLEPTDMPAHLAGDDDEAAAVVRIPRPVDRGERPGGVPALGPRLGPRRTNAGHSRRGRRRGETSSVDARFS